MRQRTFLIALLTALTATLGIMACAGTSQDRPTPTPTLTPTKPVTPTPVVPKAGPPPPGEDALVGAFDWTKRNHSMLADTLVYQSKRAAPFLDSSITAQIRENVRTEVKFPVAIGNSHIDFIVPAEVISIFNVDKPLTEGTYRATLPVSLIVDSTLPMEERAIGYQIDPEKFSLEKLK